MKVARGALLSLLGPSSRRDEETTTANVGAFEVPIGAPLRAVFPTTAKNGKRVRVTSPEGAVFELDVVGEPPTMEELENRAWRELRRLTGSR